MNSKNLGNGRMYGLAGAALIALVMGPSPVMAADAVSLSAKLDGASEPAGGDTKGSGAFSAQIDPETGDLCYTLTAKGIGAPTMAHIHKGAAGSNGDVVVNLNITTDGDECAALQRDLAKAITANPSAYYVNVHNAAFPKGALRGQLAGPQSGAAATAAPEAAATPAPAAAEVPAPASPPAVPVKP